MEPTAVTSLKSCNGKTGVLPRPPLHLKASGIKSAVQAEQAPQLELVLALVGKLAVAVVAATVVVEEEIMPALVVGQVGLQLVVVVGAVAVAVLVAVEQEGTLLQEEGHPLVQEHQLPDVITMDYTTNQMKTLLLEISVTCVTVITAKEPILSYIGRIGAHLRHPLQLPQLLPNRDLLVDYFSSRSRDA